jgi:hypothetical protein
MYCEKKNYSRNLHNPHSCPHGDEGHTPLFSGRHIMATTLDAKNALASRSPATSARSHTLWCAGKAFMLLCGAWLMRISGSCRLSRPVSARSSVRAIRPLHKCEREQLQVVVNETLCCWPCADFAKTGVEGLNGSQGGILFPCCYYYSPVACQLNDVQ